MLFCRKYVNRIFIDIDRTNVKLAGGLFFFIDAGNNLKLRNTGRNCIVKVSSGFFNRFVEITGLVDGLTVLPGKTNQYSGRSIGIIFRRIRNTAPITDFAGGLQ